MKLHGEWLKGHLKTGDKKLQKKIISAVVNNQKTVFVLITCNNNKQQCVHKHTHTHTIMTLKRAVRRTSAETRMKYGESNV